MIDEREFHKTDRLARLIDECTASGHDVEVKITKRTDGAKGVIYMPVKYWKQLMVLPLEPHSAGQRDEGAK